MKFDGRAFAREIEEELIGKMAGLVSKPKIVSFLVGDHPASTLYTRLKKEAAERVGIQFEVIKIDSEQLTADSLRQQIAEIGARADVTGVMVQLPVLGPRGEASLQGEALQEVLRAIPLSKDVDGLRYSESGVVPPVVTAILRILERIAEDPSATLRTSPDLWKARFVVVGAGGSVGSALCIELQKRGVVVEQIDSDTNDPTRRVLEGQVVISCVGKEGVVTAEMVKDGAVLVDVGAPKGDITKEAYQKASVSVEVPGGVGPVTIASLMNNTVNIWENVKDVQI